MQTGAPDNALRACVVVGSLLLLSLAALRRGIAKITELIAADVGANR